MTEAVSQIETDRLHLHLDGFDGPLDLLLDLARRQKLDLAQISILQLVEQYLAIIEGARDIRLELAADWLVMAAWLAWLKSRLLVPSEPLEDDDIEDATETLAARLRDLQAMRRASAWLDARPVLGRDVFSRGMPEDHTEVDRSALALDMPSLVRAYLGAVRRAGGRKRYQPRPRPFWSVGEALARLVALLGRLPPWSSLEQFLPPVVPSSPGQHRAALASTLVAGLELARSGRIGLRQAEEFGPILIGPPDAEAQCA